jgi:hypothetical protein
MSYGPNKPDRTISPGGSSEEDRRKLIAQQRSALYGESHFAEPGYGAETGPVRAGLPGAPGPTALRGQSPLAYDYGRAPAVHINTGHQPSAEASQGPQSAGLNEQSRANSTSPQSNPGSKGMFDASGTQQSNRTSASSPGGSPPRQGAPGSKPSQGSVAPIGTRPSATTALTNPVSNKRDTTQLSSPLSQGYIASANDENSTPSSTGPTNPSSATTEAPSVGLAGWGARPHGWGSKPGLGVQASVWG